MSTTTKTSVQDTLAALRERALRELSAASDLAGVSAWERTYLGAKGELTTFLRGLGGL